MLSEDRYLNNIDNAMNTSFGSKLLDTSYELLGSTVIM